MTKPENKLDAVRARYQLPARIVDLFAQLLESDQRAAQNVARDLAEIAGLSGKNGSNESPRTERSSTDQQFGSVVSFFRANDNRAATKTEITRQTGILDSALHRLLYATHQKEFCRGPNPRGGKAKVFRLADHVYENVKGGMSDA